jgi:hypothetical protein
VPAPIDLGAEFIFLARRKKLHHLPNRFAIDAAQTVELFVGEPLKLGLLPLGDADRPADARYVDRPRAVLAEAAFL